MKSREIAQLAAKAALDRHAYDVIIIDLTERETFTDFFVICSANSSIHLESICQNVIEELERHQIQLHHREGLSNSSWVVLDYIDVIVHIFLEEAREFYQLERLWIDSPITELGGEPPKEKEEVEIEGIEELIEEELELFPLEEE